ncbi:hypothetical protein AAFF_G00153790 [Aldrovandia affinis]|uniref:Uncharacterized protein n=1 Tax=Aldrovandia affinis TaxID=143900 RepID=A0AAD7T1Q0_9TELE|nr:hypothetical protein AAFF_G00153790 [Aldrovandia affinis]
MVLVYAGRISHPYLRCELSPPAVRVNPGCESERAIRSEPPVVTGEPVTTERRLDETSRDSSLALAATLECTRIRSLPRLERGGTPQRSFHKAVRGRGGCGGEEEGGRAEELSQVGSLKEHDASGGGAVPRGITCPALLRFPPWHGCGGVASQRLFRTD